VNLAPIYHVIVLFLSPLKEGARKFCSSLSDRRGEESVVFVPIPLCSVLRCRYAWHNGCEYGPQDCTRLVILRHDTLFTILSWPERSMDQNCVAPRVVKDLQWFVHLSLTPTFLSFSFSCSSILGIVGSTWLVATSDTKCTPFLSVYLRTYILTFLSDLTKVWVILVAAAHVLEMLCPCFYPGPECSTSLPLLAGRLPAR
jgi:hypothetical protein